MSETPDAWVDPSIASLTSAMRSLASDDSSRTLADLLDSTAGDHRPNRDTCFHCGHGDTPWPCADWMQVLYVASGWIERRVKGEDT